ncbi:hypothetical protein GCM10018793_39660 [Streptomyces sulfonofaciens]|uniref:Uncharacterized protein n=1 Tax=Streptomyces sulfonofaciens TaxID=68272 RepID=A0A919GCY2_9ACTN|nr:hypothetical protein GCM10018793_39660 [Streptomyces sulfonofaciens]
MRSAAGTEMSVAKSVGAGVVREVLYEKAGMKTPLSRPSGTRHPVAGRAPVCIPAHSIQHHNGGSGE